MLHNIFSPNQSVEIHLFMYIWYWKTLVCAWGMTSVDAASLFCLLRKALCFSSWQPSDEINEQTRYALGLNHVEHSDLQNLGCWMMSIQWPTWFKQSWDLVLPFIPFDDCHEEKHSSFLSGQSREATSDFSSYEF